MTRRILTIILAIALAVLGTGAVLLYVGQADQRALAGQRAVAVLVATQRIPAGTPAGTALRDGMLSRQELPARSVPADAVRALTPRLAALVASADIPSGELLLRPMLGTAAAAASGIAIPAGDIAVTIALCVPQAVAGYVSPGSQVAVFDTVVVSGGANGSCGGATGQAGARGQVYTRIVLPKVTVLAIGQAPASPSGSSPASAAFSSASQGAPSANGTVLVTLAVDQSDAERVITLVESGLPYLALLGQSSVTGPDHRIVPLFPPFK